MCLYALLTNRFQRRKQSVKRNSQNKHSEGSFHPNMPEVVNVPEEKGVANGEKTTALEDLQSNKFVV